MPGEQRRLQSAGVFIMLTILFKILGILGIVLLILLGITLAVIALVLFFPIFYKAIGKKDSEELRLSVRARWLFGLLRVSCDYPDPGKLQVKILFFTLYDSSVEKPQKETASSPTEPEETGPANKTQDLPVTDNAISDTASEAEDMTSVQEKSPVTDTANRVYRFFEKIRYTFRKICDRIRHILQNISFYKELWNDPDTQGLLRHAGKRIGHLLKSLRPRKITVNAVFGTGSPDTTGYLYGIYGMLLPKLGKGIAVQPDFEQAVLEGDFKASGHFTVACILFHSVLLLLDKRLRRLRDRIKQYKKTQSK